MRAPPGCNQPFLEIGDYWVIIFGFAQQSQ
jgi:hypothetical protein